MTISLRLVLSVFAFLLYCIPDSFAESLENIKQNEVISIVGENFGSSKGTICFDSTQSCYISESEGIHSWGDALIKITVPGDIPAGGNIMIYNSNNNLVIEKHYTLFSDIVQLSDEELIVDGLPVGETLRIDAFGLGTEKGSVTFGDSSSSRGGKVLEWNYYYVLVEVPDAAKSSEVFVHPQNGNSASAKFSILQPVTDDEFSSYQEYLQGISMDKVWSLINPKEEVVVAVIDDGIYQNHPDLVGQLWENEDEEPGNNTDDDQNGYVDDFLGYNFKYNTNEVTQLGSHGTTVAGIIGAIKDNKIGIAGIAEKVKIMPLIVCGSSGCEEEDIVEAIHYAVDNGARVINLSLSGEYTTSFSTVYDEAVEYACSKNVLLVIAAGNGDPKGGKGYNLTSIPQSPVCNDEENHKMILGVGASSKNEKEKTDWSNYGECVDVYAPGEGIVSTTAPASKEDSLYTITQKTIGTSFAAPMVAGLAACIISEYPEISNTALYDYIVKNAENGVINAEKTINDLRENFSESDVFDVDKIEIAAEEDEVENLQLEEANFVEFIDIQYSKYKIAILDLQEKGILGGYPDNTFKPSNTINRAEFIKIVMEAAPFDFAQGTEGNCFDDVKDEWFAQYVCVAKENGVISGYADNTFHPSKEINVAEALKITLNAFRIWTREVNKDEDWFTAFVEYAKENDLYLTDFTPARNIRRGEMSEIIYRILLN